MTTDNRDARIAKLRAGLAEAVKALTDGNEGTAWNLICETLAADDDSARDDDTAQRERDELTRIWASASEFDMRRASALTGATGCDDRTAHMLIQAFDVLMRFEKDR